MSATINVFVSNLRREPTQAKQGYERDFLQETQLLYGESVTVVEKIGEWCRILARQQSKFVSDLGWSGYPGWIESDHLSFLPYCPNYVIQQMSNPVYQAADKASPVICELPFGARCRVSNSSPNWLKVYLIDGRIGFSPITPPSSIIVKASRFIGSPYLWGGCSPLNPNLTHINTSVDCSGLIHLLFRSEGVIIPRDASDQHRVCRPTETLVAGDLVFRADPKTPEKIDHVMLFEGGELFIEACLEPMCVRRITSMEKFGVDVHELSNRVLLEKHVVFFGRFGCFG